MKRILPFFIVLAVIAAGCGGNMPANNASAPANHVNSTPLPTNANAMANTSANTYKSANNYADSKSGNTMKPANLAPPSNMKATSGLPTPPPEKKEEGLFSFPPPKVTDVFAIDSAKLINPSGETNLSQISDKLAAALKGAGYGEGKFSYFWNDQREFAIVTAMERVHEDGTKITDSIVRWDKTAAFPSANGLRDYFSYVIRGKKVYYRVFAFVVTPTRDRRTFTQGTPPDFVTASKWANSPAGRDQLGDGGGSTEIEQALFSENYKCYALLYLFVNHTSLDMPKAVDQDDEKEIRNLIEGLNTSAEEHLKNSQIYFGG
jgi:hypothetical protein